VAGVLAQARSPVGGDGSRPGEDPVPPRARDRTFGSARRRTGGGYDQSQPMTDLQKFPNAVIPAWRSGDSGTVAPSGGTFLNGAR
jgi:hypothetical protein